MKKLQDYLHYYLGATFITNNSEGEVNPETLRFIYPMIENGKCVQLVLHRLDDMTEDECLAVHQISPFWAEGTSERYIKERLYVIKDRIIHLHLTPQVFQYLLRHGFDLFGLIDARLAIDAKNYNK